MCAVIIKGVAVWLFSVAQMASAELGACVAGGRLRARQVRGVWLRVWGVWFVF